MVQEILEREVLYLRTTNINVRISPILKMRITEAGARMGVNLSDYINYVLTKSMSGEADIAVEDTPQYQELQAAYEALLEDNETLSTDKNALKKQFQTLQEQYKTLHAEWSKYDAISVQFKQDVGQPLTLAGKTHRPQHPSEVINLLLQTIQIKR
jgi:antitoxin component of RelBE/YafQ-DinJ toxin-antitoxin module